MRIIIFDLLEIRSNYMRNVEYDICKSIVTRIRIETTYRPEGRGVKHVEYRKEESQFLRVTRVREADGVGLRKGTKGRDAREWKGK